MEMITFTVPAGSKAQGDKMEVSATPDQSSTSTEEETCSSTVHTEYEAQHFGYTPTPLLNGMYNAICDIYREALKSFSKICYEKYPTVMGQEELAKAGREVGKLVDRDVTEAFDVFEAYLMKTVFNIPKGVLLPEDTCQLKLPTSLEERKKVSTNAENRKMELKQKIIAVKYANAVLRNHLEESKSLKSELQTLKENMDTSAVEASQVRDHLSFFSETLRSALRPDGTGT